MPHYFQEAPLLRRRETRGESPPERPTGVAQNIRHHFVDSWSAYAPSTLLNGLLTLLEVPKHAWKCPQASTMRLWNDGRFIVATPVCARTSARLCAPSGPAAMAASCPGLELRTRGCRGFESKTPRRRCVQHPHSVPECLKASTTYALSRVRMGLKTHQEAETSFSTPKGLPSATSGQAAAQ